MISKTKNKIIYVDITTKCQMTDICTVCYQKGNEERDVVNLRYFEEVCRKLPQQVFFRLIGGEPTLSPDILDFIKIGRQYNHIISVVTNGIKLADINFCRELIDADVSAIALSINDDSVETQKLKLAAFYNLIQLDFKNIVLMSTILKHKNEHMISFLANLGKEYGDYIVDMHFRNQFPAGKYNEKYNISFDDLKKLVLQNVEIETHYKHCHGRCCWIGKTKSQHNLKICDGASEDVLVCPDRGKLLLGNELKPFFVRMREK